MVPLTKLSKEDITCVKHDVWVVSDTSQAHDALTMSPHFFLDMLYAHEPPSNTNMCEVSNDWYTFTED